MTIQTYDEIYTQYHLVGAPNGLIPSSYHPSNSKDYGFGFDKIELGLELAAPNPSLVAGLSIESIESVGLDSLYRWFIS